MEAIQIQLVKKGGKAPGATAKPYVPKILANELLEIYLTNRLHELERREQRKRVKNGFTGKVKLLKNVWECAQKAEIGVNSRPHLVLAVGASMDLRKLKTLIDLVSESNVSELEITEAEGKVRIVKSGGNVVQQFVAAPNLY